MLDEYWFGPTSRISPEAPVPVVRVTGSEARAGGAANVAVNLASLGARTTVTGLVGRDANADTLAGLLRGLGVVVEFATAPGRPTITKLRVLSRNQQLIRLDTEDRFAADDAAGLTPVFDRLLAGVRVCILSDYAKGTLDRVDALIAACRARGVPVLVDPKGTDFARYRGATVLTPNLAEFEAVVGPARDLAEIATLGNALRERLGIDALVVTLGERGMAVLSADADPVFLPARARQVFDVTGAGDTVIATLAAGMGAGMPLAD
ncbi:MAG: bifunctional hydroxymethylpyrimidine kinase/phosphomethylpyrimidine kinase, partial [Gammaproteobacteria bacterium]|nr:bifunctional hydroxymethylpyrimidine kinase/phosphomethylpyrimidine kinase [Gammaproteobacteria bacterium]